MKRWEIIERFLLGGKGSGHWGHAGRKGSGEKGGSLPRSTAMSLKTGVDWEERWHKARGEDFGYGHPPDKVSVGRKEARFIVRGENTSDWVTKSVAKDAIMTQLSQDTGLDYATVNTVIHQWANSSNDTDYRSLFMQEMISKEFGVQLSDWQQEKIDEQGRIWKDPEGRRILLEYSKDYSNTPLQLDIMHKYGLRGGYEVREHMPTITTANPEKDTRAILRAMYEHTQKELAAKGITEVTLYRGGHVQELSTPVARGLFYKYSRTIAEPGEVIRPVQNGAESWSTRKLTANSFGDMTISMTVPAGRILGTARTGFGCLNEQEFVMLGSQNDRALVEAR